MRDTRGTGIPLATSVRPMVPSRTSSGSPVDDVRRYYAEVAPRIDLELRTRGDEGFWRSLVQRFRPSRILELGCGTGRVTRLLTGGGGTVTGVDVSPEMLRRAREHLEGGSGENVHLLLADIRHLPLRGPIDLVVAPDDPFIHLVRDEDRDRVLSSVAALLHPRGRLVLDGLWWTPRQEERARRDPGLVLERTVPADNGPDLRIRETWTLEEDGIHVQGQYRYARGRRKTGEARFRGRRWTVPELRERLERAGLRLTRLLGGYDGRPWAPDTADALLAEAELPETDGTIIHGRRHG